LVLQPRKFKFKLKHKRRRLNYKVRPYASLFFGQVGLVLTRPLSINSKKMFRLKLFLKKAARRVDKTSRKVWVNTFPHIPLTKKVIGSRMGKGKGKLSIWFNKLSTGVVLIELKNLRRGRAIYFLSQAQNKLKSTSKIVFCKSFEKHIHGPLGGTTIFYQSFW
jgi:large subunit ribosomal protein L16